MAALLIGATMQQQTDTTIAARAGARVQVEVLNGNVTVRTWNRSAVRVQATHDRMTRIDVRSNGSMIRVEPERRGGPASADLLLTLPAGAGFSAEGVSMDADVQGLEGDIDLETVTGTLRVSGGKGRVRLESVEGNIILSEASGAIDVSTVNRGIHLSGVSGTVHAETVNGPIIMERMQTGSINAETVNGTIVYDGELRAGGEYSLATHNGTVWLIVPERAGARIEITTYTGSVDPSFPVTVRKAAEAGSQSFSFVTGNGGASVNIESFGGDVRLRRPGENRPRFSESRLDP